MNRKAVAVALLCFVVSIFRSITPVMAQETDLAGLIQSLQKQMTELQTTVAAQRIEIQELKSRGAGIQMAPSGVEATPPMSEAEFKQRLSDSTGGADKWLKGLKFSGDMRLRYEAFQNTNGTSSENDDRNRFRYRLRFGWEKKFTDEMKAGFYLASGERAGTDSTSTNTSLDENFSWKPIFIEKVFATYAPNWAKVGPISLLEITAGKMNNPFEAGSSDIVWDRDVKPEGIYEKANFNLLDTGSYDLKGYATAGQFVLDEDSATSGGGDANLFAYQLGLNQILYTDLMERPIDVKSAVSYYTFGKYATGSNFSSLGQRGNPYVPNSTSQLAAGEFELVEFYNEISLYPFGLPVRPYFDWVSNIGNKAANWDVAGTDGSNAWALGVKLGGINKKGDWEISYAYKRIGRNAVPGFNDSDFGYSGHSGVRGSHIKAGYALTDYLTVNAGGIFANNLNVGTRLSGGASSGILDQEQRRFQLDLVWKF
ncbi:MAG: putative porin [Candidatus Omnitrophica bacterium]|nr:putative porin [Candidatus Omnitrophota bacterium]